MRDPSGDIRANTSTPFRFVLRQGGSGGAIVYDENHTPTTDALGLVNLTIGMGSPTLGTWSQLDWGNGPYYLQVFVSGEDLGSQRLESVPFAKVATNMQLNHLTDVSMSLPLPGEVLRWDGNQWVPAADEVNDAGADPSNELQTIQKSGNMVTLSNNGGSFTDAVNDADASPSNELQTLSLSGNTLSLSSGGGSVSLAPFVSPWSSSGGNVYYNQAGGSVGIGTVSPQAKLQVSSATDEDALRVIVGSSTRLRVLANGGVSVGANSQNTPAEGLYVHKDARINGRVYPNSDNTFTLGQASLRWSAVYAANGFIQTSDRRLKQDISPLAYGLSTLMTLRPVSFRWKSEPDGPRKIGLIAQEVQAVLPEVVHQAEDPEAPLGVNYAELVPLLIQAIQEQQARIETLEAQLGE
ncbi:MAG: hypothetical protein OHK0039_29260 [Bacteroidia bacterium]